MKVIFLSLFLLGAVLAVPLAKDIKETVAEVPKTVDEKPLSPPIVDPKSKSFIVAVNDGEVNVIRKNILILLDCNCNCNSILFLLISSFSASVVPLLCHGICLKGGDITSCCQNYGWQVGTCFGRTGHCY